MCHWLCHSQVTCQWPWCMLRCYMAIPTLENSSGPLWIDDQWRSGWWLTDPSEKYEFVSWGYYSQYMEKSSINVPNHQPVIDDHPREEKLTLQELRGSPVLVCTPGFPLSWPPVFGFLSYVLAFFPRRIKWQEVTRRSYSVSVPIGSMVLLYMVSHLSSIYPLTVSIYIYIPYNIPAPWIRCFRMTAGESWMTSSSS